MDLLREKWVAIDGSIYTDSTVVKKSDFTGKPFEQPQRCAIAFNVGHKVATHIVKLHNDEVARAHP